jgi:2-polyprenyl-3-methyl-5-hydroxy-6-metoxy-1,4-benzoquinol methylase
MAGFAVGAGPGGFDEAQAHAYAAATDIETQFLHDQVFLDILRHHAHGAALDLGGGMGRYAAWLLHMGLASSAHVIDKSPSMINGCLRSGFPGLSGQVDDIETVDLGREKYDIVLARFVLMHVRGLESTLNHIAMSMKDSGTLVIVTNIVGGTSAAMATFTGATSRIMKLILQTKGGPIPVFNYVRTQEEYTNAIQQAGCLLEFCEKYEPQILRLEREYAGISLSHLVLMGKK